MVSLYSSPKSDEYESLLANLNIELREKNLMANLLLAAGGRGGVSSGGGASNSELTNWDGTKKKTGWGRLQVDEL